MKGYTVCILCSGSFILGCTITINLIILGDETSRTVSQPTTDGLMQRLQTLLLILILSSPRNALQREAIRETWLSNMDSKFHEVYFVIGTNNINPEIEANLSHENSKHRDLMLLSNVNDTYGTLTQKVLSAFKSIHSSGGFKFILKCDDDTYVNLKQLTHELETFENTGVHSLYWGFFRGDAKVKMHGQWKETDWNICDNYVPYALGGGYVLSKDLVDFIASNSEQWRLFRSEDVSIGAWLAAVKTKRKHDIRFDTEHHSRGCLNNYLLMHKQSPRDMRDLNSNLKSTGKLCTNEVIIVPPFEYNWNVLPSKCCIRFNNKF